MVSYHRSPKRLARRMTPARAQRPKHVMSRYCNALRNLPLPPRVDLASTALEGTASDPLKVRTSFEIVAVELFVGRWILFGLRHRVAISSAIAALRMSTYRCVLGAFNLLE
ncbi:unnamed protein product [Colias eurytheme]|nr:unnamed protein product [Colias eurytheme]